MAEAPLRITSATVIEDGKPTPYCKVTGYVSPQVQFEVCLLVFGWTQRFLQTGWGDLCGNTNIHVGNDGGCTPAERGELALASTNMGRNSTCDGVWGAIDPRRRIDFAYRGVHVTALAAKAIIEKYYGQKPKYSYFAGYSGGGREALMEAQGYPSDFNGVTAGAPAMNFITQNTFYHGWNAPHDPIGGMPVQQDAARDGLQSALMRSEKLASSRWSQPIAKTRSRCTIRLGDRGHRQTD